VAGRVRGRRRAQRAAGGDVLGRRAFTPARTIEQARQETVYTVTEEQREYIAALICRDAVMENEPIRVQDGVAWAAINYSRTYGIEIQQVVSRGLTMIPLNHTRTSTYLFSLNYIRSIECRRHWNAALARADQLLTRGRNALSDPSLGCVTHYVRKPRSTHNEPPEIIQRLVNEMRELPPGGGANPGVARFFCPR
jgi:hypothetical protein